MRYSGQAASGSGDRSPASTGSWTDSRLTSGRGSAASPPSRMRRYGYGAAKCHMSRPVSRASTCDTAQNTGTNPTTRVRVSRRLSEAPAMIPSASASTMVVNTKPDLISSPFRNGVRVQRNRVTRHESQTQFGRSRLLQSIRDPSETAEKRGLMRPVPVHVDGLEPQRLGLIVRTVTVTRRAGGLSRAPSMHHHRVVPRGETVREVERVARADCRCHCSIETHVTPTRMPGTLSPRDPQRSPFTGGAGRSEKRTARRHLRLRGRRLTAGASRAPRHTESLLIG